MFVRTLDDLAGGKGEIHVVVVEPSTVAQRRWHGSSLDKHERHRLKVTRRMRVICTLVPPLVRGEIHDVEGSYDAG